MNYHSFAVASLLLLILLSAFYAAVNSLSRSHPYGSITTARTAK
jgi:CHASE3 domain sensor protein